VEETVARSPAAEAGLRLDDLILYVDGFSVPTIKSFREVMKTHGPGDEVKLDLQRDNKLVSVRLKLANQPKVAAAP
jgi:S1-C subfamily serine protease